MSLADIGYILFPEWLREWIRLTLLPALGLSPYHITAGMLRGVLDSFILLFLALGLLRGSDYYMQSQYTLSPEIQAKIIKLSLIHI